MQGLLEDVAVVMGVPLQEVILRAITDKSLNPLEVSNLLYAEYQYSGTLRVDVINYCLKYLDKKSRPHKGD